MLILEVSSCNTYCYGWFCSPKNSKIIKSVCLIIEANLSQIFNWTILKFLLIACLSTFFLTYIFTIFFCLELGKKCPNFQLWRIQSKTENNCWVYFCTLVKNLPIKFSIVMISKHETAVLLFSINDIGICKSLANVLQ